MRTSQRVHVETHDSAHYQNKGRCGGTTLDLPTTYLGSLSRTTTTANGGRGAGDAGVCFFPSAPRQPANGVESSSTTQHPSVLSSMCVRPCSARPHAARSFLAFDTASLLLIPPKGNVLLDASSHTLQVEESLTTPCGARLHPQTTQRTLALPTPEGMIVRPAPCKPRGGHSAAAWPL